jgi:hypothetical protein
MVDLGNIQAACGVIFIRQSVLQGEQNLEITIKKYIEGFYSPMSLKLLSHEIIGSWILSLSLQKA